MKIRKKILAQAGALALTASLAVALAPSSALGDTVSSASSAAYGVRLAGPVPIGATPEVSASLTSTHAEDSVIEVPADPLATSFTASVTADAAKESTLDALLQATMTTARAGAPTKWNAIGHAITEDLVAVNATIKAGVLESEASAACVDGDTVFASAARLVDLSVGGTAVPLPAPNPNQVVFNQGGITITMWETNWDPSTGALTDGGETVFSNALHVIAPGGIDLVVSHSEATSECGAKVLRPAPKAECEDGVDNRDPEDKLADEKDPGCHSDGDASNPNSYNPNDDNERDDAECSDGVDNADPEDSLADENDPGCHSDGNPANASSYNPNDDDETDGAANRPAVAPPAAAVGGTPAFTG